MRSTAVSIVIIVALLGGSSAPAVAAADEGHSLFVRHCAGCHGADGRGSGPDSDLFPSPPRDLHEGFIANFDDATLARRIREGRSLPLFLDRDALRRHVAEVDALVDHLRRLPKLDWSVIEPGWSAYVARCEVCHGPTGEGPAATATAATPADLSRPETWKATKPKERRAALRHQRDGMTPIDPPVSPAEGAAIAAFVDLFSPGFSAYSRHCANCHADDGRGVATLGDVPGEVFPLPAVSFDAAYFRETDGDKLRDAVWHMLETRKPSMPHFRAVLTDAEAAAIVAWLRRQTHSAPRAE